METLAQPRRRAIVILSDGEDTSSLVAYDEVLALAARSDVAIYAIGLQGRDISGAKRPNEAQFVLRRFAEQTGGRAFFPGNAKELASIYGEIKAELAGQYFLAYESDNARRDGQFRRVAVRVERAGCHRAIAARVRCARQAKPQDQYSARSANSIASRLKNDLPVRERDQSSRTICRTAAAPERILAALSIG